MKKQMARIISAFLCIAILMGIPVAVTAVNEPSDVFFDASSAYHYGDLPSGANWIEEPIEGIWNFEILKTDDFSTSPCNYCWNGQWIDALSTGGRTAYSFVKLEKRLIAEMIGTNEALSDGVSIRFKAPANGLYDLSLFIAPEGAISADKTVYYRILQNSSQIYPASDWAEYITDNSEGFTLPLSFSAKENDNIRIQAYGCSSVEEEDYTNILFMPQIMKINDTANGRESTAVYKSSAYYPMYPESTTWQDYTKQPHGRWKFEILDVNNGFAPLKYNTFSPAWSMIQTNTYASEFTKWGDFINSKATLNYGTQMRFIVPENGSGVLKFNPKYGDLTTGTTFYRVLLNETQVYPETGWQTMPGGEARVDVTIPFSDISQNDEVKIQVRTTDSEAAFEYGDVSFEMTRQRKAALFIGDSICNGGATGGYAQRISQSNNLYVDNAAWSGATVTGWGLYDQATAHNNNEYEYVFIQAGINDAMNNSKNSADCPIGTMVSHYYYWEYIMQEFCGSLEFMLNTVTTQFPDAKIGYIIPYQCPAVTKDVTDPYYAEIRKICQKWGVSYLDLNNDASCTETFCTGDNVAEMLADNLHPTDAGYDVLAARIESWMTGLNKYNGHGLRGDLNGDKNVNAFDLNICRRHITEAETCISVNIDANGDGIADVRDLIRLKKIISGTEI